MILESNRKCEKVLLRTNLSVSLTFQCGWNKLWF